MTADVGRNRGRCDAHQGAGSASRTSHIVQMMRLMSRLLRAGGGRRRGSCRNYAGTHHLCLASLPPLKLSFLLVLPLAMLSVPLPLPLLLPPFPFPLAAVAECSIKPMPFLHRMSLPATVVCLHEAVLTYPVCCYATVAHVAPHPPQRIRMSFYSSESLLISTEDIKEWRKSEVSRPEMRQIVVNRS